MLVIMSITVVVLLLLIVILGEFVYLKFSHQAPMIPSSHYLRQAVVTEINTHYKQLVSVLDIGSGYGGLARQISRECPEKSVVAVEKMLFTALCSKMIDRVSRTTSRTIRRDAFDYIEESPGFDIGVAYLFPSMMPAVATVRHKFKVLIVLDFPLPYVTPSRKVKLHKDTFTSAQHWLYIYEQTTKKSRNDAGR
jgi:hypothetical protein